MFKQTFLNTNFFISSAFCGGLYVLAYNFESIWMVANLTLVAFVIAVVLEWWKLSKLKDDLIVNRKVAPKLSLSDGDHITYTIENKSSTNIDLELYDELPYQFQHRKPIFDRELLAGDSVNHEHFVQPYVRGAYEFGQVHAFIAIAPFKFLDRRISYDLQKECMVVPSIVQMKKYELQVFSKVAALSGIRQIRQLGENDEFEHIRPYSQGDNIKAINWKATSRKNQLMVNQYQNTRHQDVYCVIDKGRAMKMPFYGLTLLDHAINSALSLSNIILKKHDYAGLISYSDRMGTLIKASSRKGQLERISQSLYKEKTGFKESNFELLAHVTRRQISRRSIWLFYTNFETPHDLRRHLPYLKLMSKRHLMVVIIFINTKLIETSEMDCETKSDIYIKTFAEKTMLEKELIREELIRNGIQTILTEPQNLTINVINKYLEIKAKRMR